MRTVFGLTSLSVVTGFCLVQACGGDDATTATPEADAGQSTSSSGATSSSGNTSSSGGSSGNTSSSGGTNDGGNTDAATDAGPKSKMTFFVTSVGTGAKGGNLGGLAGADAICKDLATKAGGGDHTWAAYLSTSTVDAKDRIGKGPWVNQKGVEIAKDLTALHAGNLKTADVVDEKGATVPNSGGGNVHDILTGSNSDGTKTQFHCKDWTSASDQEEARVGHSDAETSANGTDRWNNANHESECDEGGLAATKGAGRIYCFAKD